MSRQVVILSVLLVVALVGCREEVATGPTGAEMEAERARVAAAVKKGRPKRVSVTTPTAGGEATGNDANFASVGDEYSYSSDGRRDPFEPYRIDSSTADAPTGGPLEQFELEQLSVVALVWDGATARAMVSDPSGTTYTIGVGSRMGKNAGRVIHIGDNLVLVKETYTDFAGEESTKDVELRIRRSQGG